MEWKKDWAQLFTLFPFVSQFRRFIDSKIIWILSIVNTEKSVNLSIARNTQQRRAENFPTIFRASKSIFHLSRVQFIKFSCSCRDTLCIPFASNDKHSKIDKFTMKFIHVSLTRVIDNMWEVYRGWSIQSRMSVKKFVYSVLSSDKMCVNNEEWHWKVQIFLLNFPMKFASQ